MRELEQGRVHGTARRDYRQRAAMQARFLGWRQGEIDDGRTIDLGQEEVSFTAADPE